MNATTTTRSRFAALLLELRGPRSRLEVVHHSRQVGEPLTAVNLWRLETDTPSMRGARPSVPSLKMLRRLARVYGVRVKRLLACFGEE